MALFSKVLPKTYPELCAVYLPRAIGDKVALRKALEAINALKGCKHLNPDQKQYLDDISKSGLSLRARLAAWARPTASSVIKRQPRALP